MFRHLAAQRVELGLNVLAVQIGQDSDQALCGVHADLVVQDRPSDLEHADEIVAGEKVVGQRRCGFGKGATGPPVRIDPVSRPVLQPEIGDRDGRI